MEHIDPLLPHNRSVLSDEELEPYLNKLNEKQLPKIKKKSTKDVSADF